MRPFKTAQKRRSSKSLLETLLESIPGREREVREVSQFVENLKIGERTPLCLSGSTGCGKTSIVKEVLRFLEDQPSQFNVIYLNCMCIANIKNLYATLLDKLFAAEDKKP